MIVVMMLMLTLMLLLYLNLLLLLHMQQVDCSLPPEVTDVPVDVVSSTDKCQVHECTQTTVLGHRRSLWLRILLIDCWLNDMVYEHDIANQVYHISFSIRAVSLMGRRLQSKKKMHSLVT
jgi:hypothetical protein